MRGVLSRISNLSRAVIRRSPHTGGRTALLSLDGGAVAPPPATLPGEFLKWTSFGSCRGSKFATGFTPLKAKPLSSIIDIGRASACSPEDLVSVWDDYHLGRGHIGISMKAQLYHLLEQRSLTCRHFVIPLWRGSGYVTMFIQGNKRQLSFLLERMRSGLSKVLTLVGAKKREEVNMIKMEGVDVPLFGYDISILMGDSLEDTPDSFGDQLKTAQSFQTMHHVLRESWKAKEIRGFFLQQLDMVRIN